MNGRRPQRRGEPLIERAYAPDLDAQVQALKTLLERSRERTANAPGSLNLEAKDAIRAGNIVPR